MNPPRHLGRWRGRWLLEMLADHQAGRIKWEHMSGPVHAKPTRGMFDPTTGTYDLNAGPRDRSPGPRRARRAIPPLPGYAGEWITLTPSSMQQWVAAVTRDGLQHAVDMYARVDQHAALATYHRTHHAIVWHADAPRGLRDAALILHAIEPIEHGRG